ncbi:MAG TPA: cupin domain-containing protein [Aeromonadales bacterium]|nr:cupin domain-containing protein [Aeromonadales bacterium]
MTNSRYILKSESINEMKGDARTHFLNPRAKRIRKTISTKVGLENIGVHIVYVESGNESTEHHKHYDEEECFYILSGEGTLRIGDKNYAIGEGDFIGFPADTAAHSIINTGTAVLIILVIGQRLKQDIADYPLKKKRLYRHDDKWDLVDWENINDPR